MALASKSKTKKKSTSLEVERVQKLFPPGTEARDKRTGELFVVGALHKNDKFWVMKYEPLSKDTLPAWAILQALEPQIAR